jgi:hypothetical protein
LISCRGGEHVGALDDEEPARPRGLRQHFEEALRRGEVFDDEPRVHEVEARIADGLGDDVVLAHLYVGPTCEMIEMRNVDVEGHDRAFRSDRVGQPGGHRAAASADFCAPPARRDPAVLQQTECARVVVAFEHGESFMLAARLEAFREIPP